MNGKKSLNITEIIGYGLTELPGTANTIIAAFLTMFYTDSIGMAAGAVGTMFFVSRLFDGISDLIAGSLVDKTKTKWGKARPWLLWLCVPIGLSLAVIFWVPQSASPTVQMIYAFITYNLFISVLYTMIGVAKAALMPLMTQNTGERSVMATLSVLVGFGGAMLGTSMTFPFINAMGGDITAWRIVFAVYGFIVTAGTLLSFCLIKEHVTSVESVKSEESAIPFKEGLKIFFNTKYFILTLILFFLVQFQLQVNSGSQTYFYKYAMGDEMLTMSMNIWNLVPMVFSLLVLATPCISILGKKKCVLLGAALHLIGYALRGLAATTGNITLLIAGTVICALGVGPMSVPVNTMSADAVDYGEWKHGKRIEGIGSSVMSVGSKLASGFAGGIVGWVLALTGFVANEVQSASANAGIIGLFAWGPAALVLAIMIIISIFYHYDDEVGQVLSDLEERKKNAVTE